MHGMVVAELKRYVVDRHGAEVWNSLAPESRTGAGPFLARQSFPDADVVALVKAVAEKSARSIDDVLEDFGDFAVPDLLRLYGGQINPAWRTLDVIENTEKTMHRIVRTQTPGAQPPPIATTRRGPNEVHVRYASPRRMCAFARGIIRGIAKHYGEKVEIEQSTCMLRGAAHCDIVVRRIP